MIDNIQIIKKFGYTYLIICTIAECLFQFSLENLVGCFVFFYGWFIFTNWVFKRENLVNFCLPSLAIFGYVIMYFILPIGVTLIEGKPVTFKFENPYLTWANLFLNISIITLAYNWALSKFKHSNIVSRFFEKIGYYSVPSNSTIWVLGIIGLLVLLYNISTQVGDLDYEEMQTGATGGALQTILKGLEVYSIMPLCLIFGKFYGSYSKINRRKIYLYLLIVLFISIATTRRSLIAYPLLSICMVFLYFAVVNNRKLLNTKRTILVAVAIYLIIGPIVDLFAAMALSRHNLGSKNDFSNIIELYNNKEKLHDMYQYLSAFQGMNSTNNLGWSEYYVDNILLDRFCNLRVQDASIFYATKLGYNNPAMHDFAADFVSFRIPTFITNALGISKVVRTSPGDLFVEQYFHETHHIGQKVAGDTGIGLYLMGYAYYPFALIVYFFVFLFLGTMTKCRNGNLVIPILVLTSFSRYFMYFVNSIGIFSSIALLMRTGWEDIFTYCIVLKISNFFKK